MFGTALAEWLSTLKVGDKVALSAGYGKVVPFIRTITHITPTQVHVSGMKWSKKNGYRIGGGRWDSVDIGPITSEVLEAIHRDGIRRKWADINWARVDEQILEALLTRYEELIQERTPVDDPQSTSSIDSSL